MGFRVPGSGVGFRELGFRGVGLGVKVLRV